MAPALSRAHESRSLPSLHGAGIVEGAEIGAIAETSSLSSDWGRSESGNAVTSTTWLSRSTSIGYMPVSCAGSPLFHYRLAQHDMITRSPSLRYPPKRSKGPPLKLSKPPPAFGALPKRPLTESLMLPVLRPQAFAMAQPDCTMRGPSAPGLRSLWLAELLYEVNSMTLLDVGGVVRYVTQLEEDGKLVKPHNELVRRELRKRAAELLATLPAEKVFRGGEVLRLLEAADVLEMLEDLDGPARSEQYHSKYCREMPQVAFEERVCYLAHKCGDKLSVLEQCHSVVNDLESCGLLRRKAVDAVSASLQRWVDHVPLAQLSKHVEIVCSLSAEDERFHISLERRFERRASESFTNPGRLAGFSRLILALQDRGVRLLDSPLQGEVTDPHRMAQKYWPAEELVLACPLQLALLNMLRSCLKRWSVEMLAEEFRGPVLALSAHHPSMYRPLILAVSSRVVKDLKAIVAAIGRLQHLAQIRQSIEVWAGFAREMERAALLESPDFDAGARQELVRTAGFCPYERREVAKHLQAVAGEVFGLGEAPPRSDAFLAVQRWSRPPPPEGREEPPSEVDERTEADEQNPAAEEECDAEAPGAALETLKTRAAAALRDASRDRSLQRALAARRSVETEPAVDALRTSAAAALRSASRDGSLQRALRARRSEDPEPVVDVLKTSAAAALRSASRDGSLQRALRARRSEDAELAADGLKASAAAALRNSSRDGSLQRALRARRSADGDAQGAELAVDGLKASAAAAFRNSSRDGSLQRALRARRSADSDAEGADPIADALRSSAAARLRDASRDGSLQRTLRARRVADSDADGADPIVGALRSSAAAGLRDASRDGSLQRALRARRPAEAD